MKILIKIDPQLFNPLPVYLSTSIILSFLTEFLSLSVYFYLNISIYTYVHGEKKVKDPMGSKRSQKKKNNPDFVEEK